MAFIRNAGQESAKDDLAEIFTLFQEQRGTLLESLRGVQLAARTLFQLEAERLRAKAGPDDPRVRDFAQRADGRLELIAALQVEGEIAGVRVPSVERHATLVHGRLVDADRRAVANTQVRLVDDKRAEVPGAKVATDASGYYAIVLAPEAAAALAGRTLFVSVGPDSARLVPASAQPITLTPAARVLQEVALNARELSRVRGALVPAARTAGGQTPDAAPAGPGAQRTAGARKPRAGPTRPPGAADRPSTRKKKPPAE